MSSTSRYAAERNLLRKGGLTGEKKKTAQANKQERILQDQYADTPISTQTARPADDNPTVGSSLFLTNPFQIKKKDSTALKAVKGLGNFGASILDAPGELIRQTSLQLGSLIGGNGVRKDLSQGTSFTKDILKPALPKKAQEGLTRFEQKRPVLSNLLTMGVDTASDPSAFIGAGALKKVDAARQGMESVASRNAKIVSRLKPTQGATSPVVEAANEALDTGQKLLPAPESAKPRLLLEAPKPRNLGVIEALPPEPIKPNTTLREAAERNYNEVASRYNDAVESVQNVFRTNDLRASEMNSVKDVTGVDLDALSSELEKADFYRNNLDEFAKRERMRLNAGVLTPEEIKYLKDIDIYEQAQRNASYTVPEPFRKEYPRTVSRSSVPPKVSPEFAREEFAPSSATSPKPPFGRPSQGGTIAESVGGASNTLTGKPLDPFSPKNIPASAGSGTYTTTGRLPSMGGSGGGAGAGSANVPPQQGSVDAFKANISHDSTKKRKTFKEVWDQLRADAVDRFAPLEKVEKDVRGNVSSAENSLYKQARMTAGTPERANVIIEKELKPIIGNVEAKGYTYKDLEAYAEAVHAKDVNAAGLNSGFSDADIDAVIKQYSADPAMEQARKDLVAYSDRRLKTLLDSEVISQDAYDAMKQKWPNYMPLNRAFNDDKVEFARGVGESIANVGQPIKTLKGSDRQVISPIESMVKNTYQLESVAARNRAGLQLRGLAADDSAGTFVRRLADDEAVGRKNVVNIKEGGQNVQYEVSHEVYKAMLAMDKESSPAWVKAMSKPAAILRAGATLTPDFALRNPIRDVMNAFIVSKSGFNPFTDFAAGLGSYIRKGKLYEDFLRNGGGYGNIISMDRQAHKQALENVIKQPLSQKVINIVNPKSWMGVLRSISDATESATKIGEFRAALRSGASSQEAAYRARDLMDFARSGNSVKELNKVVAFLNANIQGKSKMIRAIKENPVKVGGKLFTTMAAPSVAIYAANNALANDTQKATIKDAPPWLKNTFWLVAIPGTDTVARIPKPFEGAFVANGIERFLDYVADNDKDAFDGFLAENAKQQSIPVMMSGITPIIEGIANYSFFRGTPLIPSREKYLMPKDQYDIYTSEISKAVAGGIQKIPGIKDTNFASPRVVDNTIRGLTAGLGGYAMEAVDTLAGKNRPAKNLVQQPVVKAFAVNDKATGVAIDYIYKELDAITKERGSAKQAKTPFRGEGQYQFLSDVTEKVSKLSENIRTIQNNKLLSPQDKRDKINVLADKRNELARKYMEQYKEKYNK